MVKYLNKGARCDTAWIYYYKIVVFFMFSVSSLYSNVSSITGNILFDVNNQSSSELILNSMGLGVGVVPFANLTVQGNVVISDYLSIGTTESHSSLFINGSIGMSIDFLNSDNIELGGNTTILVDTSSDNIHTALPYAGNVSGRVYNIKKATKENYLFVSGGGNLIDNRNSYILHADKLSSLSVISNGIQWYIIDSHGNPDQLHSDNLLLHYSFEDTNGNTLVDQSNNNNNGTLKGGFTMEGNTTGGVLGQALSFDGTNDYVELDSTIGLSDFSISLWINMSDYNMNPQVQVIGNASNSLMLYVFLNEIRFFFTSGGVSLTSPAVNQWHHIAITRKNEVSPANDTVKMYLNGQLKLTDLADRRDGDFTSPSNRQIKYLGRDFDGDYFPGKIDEVKIFNSILSEDEVFALYKEGQ